MKIFTEPILAVYISRNHTWDGCPHIADSYCNWFTDKQTIFRIHDIDKISQPICGREGEPISIPTWNRLTENQQVGKEDIDIQFRMSKYDWEDPWDTSNPNEVCTCSCTYKQPIRLIFHERLSPDQVKENLINAYFKHLFDYVLAEDESIDHGIMSRLETIAKDYWHWSSSDFINWLDKIADEIDLRKQKIDKE